MGPSEITTALVHSAAIRSRKKAAELIALLAPIDIQPPNNSKCCSRNCGTALFCILRSNLTPVESLTKKLADGAEGNLHDGDHVPFDHCMKKETVDRRAKRPSKMIQYTERHFSLCLDLKLRRHDVDVSYTEVTVSHTLMRDYSTCTY